ncbi:MAG: hypothetical protein KIT14_06235 [bacterium]|nr:hypothetical protein [bacterium]
MSNKKIIGFAAAAGVAVIAGGLLLLSEPAQQSKTPAGAVAEQTATAPATPDGVASSGAEDGGLPDQAEFRRKMARAMRIHDAAEREAVIAALLDEWLQLDPGAIRKYLMALEVNGELDKLDVLAGAFAKALGNLPPSVVASPAVRDLVTRFATMLARQDPETALELATTFLEDDNQASTLVQVARTLAERDPMQGLRLAEQITSPFRRQQALAWVAGIWAKSDPTAAVAWASGLKEPTEQAMALNAALSAMAQTDPESAAAQLVLAERTLQEEHTIRRNQTMAELGISEADLLNAPETAEDGGHEVVGPKSPEAELLAEAARLTAMRLAAEQATAAIAFAESIENDFVRQAAVRGALAGWSRVDPAAAAEYAVNYQTGNADMIATVYDVWASSAPAAAAAAALTIGDPMLRAAAIQTVAATWSIDEPRRAALWLDQLPETERSDAALFAVVANLAPENPVAAFQRAQAIQDPQLQYRGLKAAFTELVIRQPAVARDLLASSSFTGNTAERLQEILAATEKG